MGTGKRRGERGERGKIRVKTRAKSRGNLLWRESSIHDSSSLIVTDHDKDLDLS